MKKRGIIVGPMTREAIVKRLFGGLTLKAFAEENPAEGAGWQMGAGRRHVGGGRLQYPVGGIAGASVPSRHPLF